MRRRYDGDGYQLDWYDVGGIIYVSVFFDGETVKEYSTEDEECAEELWEKLCQMVDFAPEDLLAFRISRNCGRALAKQFDIFNE